MESMINRNVWIISACSIIPCTVIEQHVSPEWFVVQSKTDGYKQTTADVFLTPAAAADEARERAALLIDAATRIEAESENE